MVRKLDCGITADDDNHTDALAPVVQAATRPIAAGGVFATLQSATMRGYGAGVVDGAMQGVGTAVAAAGAPLTEGGGKAADEKDEGEGVVVMARWEQ
jgi:hypothetical protein